MMLSKRETLFLAATISLVKNEKKPLGIEVFLGKANSKIACISRGQALTMAFSRIEQMSREKVHFWIGNACTVLNLNFQY